jgi:hypothetical protein
MKDGALIAEAFLASAQCSKIRFENRNTSEKKKCKAHTKQRYPSFEEQHCRTARDNDECHLFKQSMSNESIYSECNTTEWIVIHGDIEKDEFVGHDVQRRRRGSDQI